MSIQIHETGRGGNYTSLALGVASMVVGVIACLIGWVPLLGLLALPVAVVGLLLAGFGFVIALCKGRGYGMPLVGAAVCFGGLALAVGVTGGLSAAVVHTDIEANAASRGEDSEKADYIRDNLQLYGFKASYTNSLTRGRVPGVEFKLKNSGDRSLNIVKVTVFFKNAQGAVIAEESFTPVLASSSVYVPGGGNPLKPGYIWQLGSGKFYIADSVPSEWVEGKAEARITDIVFTPDR